jgi:hypothetical protein
MICERVVEGKWFFVVWGRFRFAIEFGVIFGAVVLTEWEDGIIEGWERG